MKRSNNIFLDKQYKTSKYKNSIKCYRNIGRVGAFLKQYTFPLMFCRRSQKKLFIGLLKSSDSSRINSKMEVSAEVIEFSFHVAFDETSYTYQLHFSFYEFTKLLELTLHVDRLDQTFSIILSK